MVSRIFGTFCIRHNKNTSNHKIYTDIFFRNLNQLTRDETSPELTTSDLGASDFRHGETAIDLCHSWF
jgi:hypothetical protein